MAFFSPIKTIHSRQPSRWVARSLQLLKHPKKFPLRGLQRQLYARDYRDRLQAITEIFDQREAGIPFLLEALHDPHDRVRELALRCLSIWPDRPEVQPILATTARYRQFTCRQTFKQHTQPITTIALHPDNRTVLSLAAGEDCFYLWDLATGTIAHQYPHPEISQAIFSHDGQQIFTNGANHQVSIWDIATGTIVQRLTGHTNRISVIHQTPDRNSLITASADGTIGIWDWGSGQLRDHQRLTGNGGAITAIAISPDAQTLFSAATDQTIRIWHLPSGQLQQIYHLEQTIVHSLAVHPTQPIIWSGDRQARLSTWNYQTHQHLDTWNSWSDRATQQIIPSADGAILYQTCGHHINLWHTATGYPIHQLIGHRATTTALAITPDGQTIVTGSDDRTIKIWA
jgi:WD40 repeat protein